MSENLNNKNNSLPNLVFVPFKTSKKISVFFMLLSMTLSVIILINVIRQKYIFTYEELKELANFTLNIVFVIAALGFTIFTLPIEVDKDKNHLRKDNIIFSYIGYVFILASIAIFAYIISYCKFFSSLILSLYFCAMLLILCGCITKLLAAIVAYFNIRD